MGKEKVTRKALLNKSLRNSIQAKMALIIILTATVIFSGYAIYDYSVTSADMKKNFEKLAEYIVNQQSKSLALPLWYMDTEAIKAVISSAMIEKQVHAVLIKDESGIAYGQMRDNNLNTVGISKEISGDYYVKSKEISKNNEELGTVEVYLTPEFMREKLDNVTGSMFIALIILNMSLVSALFFSIRKSVILPVSHVAESVRIIASGHLDSSIHSERKDEIGQLVSNVESMRLTIKKNLELVREKNEALQIEIMDRERAEEALRKSERLLNETQMLTKVGGWEYDVGEKKMTWTDQVYHICGVNRETYDPNDIEKNVSFYGSEDRKTIEQAFVNAWDKNRSYDLELQFMSAKGEDLWVRTMGNPVLENGKVTKVVGNIMDITEPKKLEETLRQAQKMVAIGTLTGGIAHDYNNLLAIIMGNLSMAKEETEPHSFIAGLLHEAEQASSKAGDLTHQLMTLSQGGYPMKELGSIESLLKEIPGQIQAHEGIEYTFSIQDDLWALEYDSRQMHYAISNVLINAVEAIPQGGKITIQAGNQVIEKKGQNSALPLNEEKYVRISIKDEGGGIPKEHLNQIFDPYFSTKERGVQKGMGLGLTTAYAVVQKHGGHIMVNSTTGVGTIVTLYLPAMGIAERGMRNAECGSAQEEEESIQSEIRNPKSAIQRILVMDDEESLRNLARKMLERLGGYKVATVKDGVEAIETYKKHMDSGEPFDMVILDLTIKGGMGGDQAIKELIKIDPDVKAIVCSGYFNDPVLANYAEHGFRGAMAKPYQIADLESVLKKVLG